MQRDLKDCWRKRCRDLEGRWSGRWETNPRLKLGKLGYYHYTTPASETILVAGHKVRQIAGFPSLTMPAGLVRGLPLGITLVTYRNQDGLLLQVARAFERAANARVAPRLMA